MRGAVVAFVVVLLSCKREGPRAEPVPIVDAGTPCNHDLTMGLASMLDSDPRALIGRTSDYLGRCGEAEDVRVMQFHARERLRWYADAIVDADALVTNAPKNPEYRVWRGDTYVQLGQSEDAAVDYREVLTLDPALAAKTGIPLKLVTVYEQQGQECEATKLLARSIAQEKDDAAKKLLEDRRAKLAAGKPCSPAKLRVAAAAKARAASPSPSMPIDLSSKGATEPESPSTVAEAGYGRALVHFTPGDVAHTSVVLNGAVRLNMVVDTGASGVAISRRVALRLGIAVDSLPTVTMRTAGGDRVAHRGTLAEVRVQGLTATRVPCFIHEDRDLGATEGLLGQSFLGRFKTTIDSRRGEIEISDAH